MKKSLLFLLSLFAALFLSACRGGYEAESRYITSAIGFDSTQNGLFATAEAVLAEATEESSNTVVFGASGTTPEDAFKEMEAHLPMALAFDHCGAVVLGDGLSCEQISAIMKFCRDKSSLNLAVLIVRAENAEELFSCNVPEAYCVGYCLMGIIKKASSLQGRDFSNRFYEVENRLSSASPCEIQLPIFNAAERHLHFGGLAPISEKGDVGYAAE